MTRLVTLLFCLGLLVAACGDDDDESTAVGTASTTTAAAIDDGATTTAVPAGDDVAESTLDGSSETTTAAPASGDLLTSTVIVIDVAGGEVTGGGRYRVAVGSAVTVQITADVADEVHVHGYDLTTDTVPGEVASMTFTADIPGVFEVELEAAGLPLFELEVQ